MIRVILLLTLAALLTGCAAESVPKGQSVLVAAPFLTKDTGQLTIERQQFIDTWASVQVLFDGYVAQSKKACASVVCRDTARCAQLPDVEAQGKVIKLTVDAKLKHPEATIDWANVAKLIGLLAKMVL